MSAENVELVRRIYDWVASSEPERAFELYADDVEWDSSGAPWILQLGFSPRYRGHDAVRGALRSWFQAWERIDYVPDELIDLGDEVLAFVRITARGRASGVDVTYDHPQLWTIRNGEVIRVRVFAERDEALRAAGLG